MWPSAWSNTPFTGCPPCQNPSNPYGSHPGVSPWWWWLQSYNTCYGISNSTMYPYRAMDSPRTRSLASSKFDGPHGMSPGWSSIKDYLSHTTFHQSSQSVSFPQGVPHNVLSLKLTRVHLIRLSHKLNMEYIIHLHFQLNKELLPYSGKSTNFWNYTIINQSDTRTRYFCNYPQSSTPSLTITQLEQRLGEAMEKKLESMTKALRSSMSPAGGTSSRNLAYHARDEIWISGLQQTLEVHPRQDPRVSTLAHRTSTGQVAQQHDIPQYAH